MPSDAPDDRCVGKRRRARSAVPLSMNHLRPAFLRQACRAPCLSSARTDALYQARVRAMCIVIPYTSTQTSGDRGASTTRPGAHPKHIPPYTGKGPLPTKRHGEHLQQIAGPPLPRRAHLRRALGRISSQGKRCMPRGIAVCSCTRALWYVVYTRISRRLRE